MDSIIIVSIPLLVSLQDNMIDEEKAKKEAAAQMTFEQKINLLNDQVSQYFTFIKKRQQHLHCIQPQMLPDFNN